MLDPFSLQSEVFLPFCCWEHCSGPFRGGLARVSRTWSHLWDWCTLHALILLPAGGRGKGLDLFHKHTCASAPPGGWGLSPAGLPPDLFPRNAIRLSGLLLFASAGCHPRGLQQSPTRTEEEKAPTESR